MTISPHPLPVVQPRVERVTGDIVVVMAARIVVRSSEAYRTPDKYYEESWFFPAASFLVPLRPSRRVFVCERIGLADLLDVQVGYRTLTAAAWRFPFPRAEYADLMGLIGIDMHRMDRLVIDGVEQRRKPAATARA